MTHFVDEHRAPLPWEVSSTAGALERAAEAEGFEVITAITDQALLRVVGIHRVRGLGFTAYFDNGKTTGCLLYRREALWTVEDDDRAPGAKKVGSGFTKLVYHGGPNFPALINVTTLRAVIADSN